MRTFIVLHQEKNARKAAERLFVSQPAISQSLRKLRHHFDDQLFVKVPNGLAPTPFSEELASKIEPYLEGLSAVLSEVDEFNPKELNQEISIALASNHALSLGGSIYRYFQEQAPNLKINLLAWNSHTARDIELGKIYLGVAHELPRGMEEQTTIFSALSSAKIGQLSPAVLVSKDHPLLKQKVTLENIAKFQLVRLIIAGYNDSREPVTIKYFKKYGYDVTYGFSSEYPLVVLEVLQESELIYMASDCFPIKKYPSLKLLKIEQLNESIITDLKSYYHPRLAHSALTHWINQSLEHIFQINRIKFN
jgi:DNA-binding transcriptional LysR family regulator